MADICPVPNTMEFITLSQWLAVVGGGNVWKQPEVWVITTGGKYELLLSSSGDTPGMLGDDPQCIGQFPTTKKYLIPNVSSAESR